MKLSMWILLDWMKEYDPIAVISEGDMSIEGVRFLSGDTACSKNYAYIRVAREINGSLLLIHRNDVIYLNAESPEDIFNSVLSAFDFYNKWEADMYEAIGSDTPEQNILDASRPVFGPMFMFDLSLKVVAYTRGYQIGELNPLWDQIFRSQNASLALFCDLRKATIAQMSPYIQHCTIYDNSYLLKYTSKDPSEKAPKSMMISYCINGELVAQVVHGGPNVKQEFTRGDIQLAEFFENMLTKIHSPTVFTYSDTFSGNILKSTLRQGVWNEFDKERLLVVENWKHTDTFCLAVFTDPCGRLSEAHARSLRSHIPDSVSILLDDRIVCLKRVKKHAEFVEKATQMAEIFALRVGISYEFKNISNFLPFYQQAVQAQSYGEKTQKAVCCFQDCALHMLTHIAPDYSCYSIHPAVQTLRQYDQENDTELSETLRTFLQTERSYSHTAQKMHIHRNTVLYRLNNIYELVELDLENPDEREYLLLSFRIMD